MTILQAVNRADKLRPNTIPRDIKTGWISELEGRLCYESEKTPYESFTPADSELKVRHPYDGIYIYYLLAMIDFNNDDLTKYNADLSLYEEAYNMFRNMESREKSINLAVSYGE